MPKVMDLADLSKAAEEEALRRQKEDESLRSLDIVDYAHARFYIEETAAPIVLLPHQQAVLRYPFRRLVEGDSRIARFPSLATRIGHFPFTTVVESTVKKGGKTTLSAVVARFFLDTQTRFGEIYCLGNDFDQARERAFKFVTISLRLTPGCKQRGSDWIIPGQYTLQKTRVECLLTGSSVIPISVDARGEAGGNPDLTVWCVSEDTECLTKGGFKFVKDLTLEDEIATLNPDTGFMEWHRPRAVNVKSYKGKMLKFRHRSVSFVVTPNHRVWGRFSDKGSDELSEWRFEEARRASRYSFGWLKGDAKWAGETYFDPLKARFLGYFISEGCTSQGRYVHLAQSQSIHPEVFQDMLSVVEALGYSLNPRYGRKGYTIASSCDEICIHDKNLVEELFPLGKSRDKYIPIELKNAQSEALQSFFEAYIAGDGHRERSEWGGTLGCNTVSKRLADDLMEVGLKLGYHPVLKIYDCEKYVSKQYGETQSYSLTFRTRPIGYTRPPQTHWEEIDYDGVVACPSVPHGIFYIRHEGKCVWTGNTELWGFDHEEARRFWQEMTPPPTKIDSIRLVETYAGYDGESELLKEEIYDLAREGVQLTAGELAGATDTPLEAFAETGGDPNALVPVWINEQASIFMYWDEGETARRMPWQRGPVAEAYYREQALKLPPPAFARLHLNQWTGGESEFVPIELWDRCQEDLPLFRPETPEPAVLAVDAAVTGDCFGIVAITRHPTRHDDVAIRRVKKWDPKESGGLVNYEEPERFLRALCTGACAAGHPPLEIVEGKRGYSEKQQAECEACRNGPYSPPYRIVQIAYDPFQLESMMQSLRRDHIAWCEPFPQMQDRLKSDRLLYDLIMNRRLAHDGDPALREHIMNCRAKHQKDQDSTVRIVKKAANRKIDLAVCASMGAYRCLYLLL